MEREETLAVYEAGPEAVINLIEQQAAIIAKLEERVKSLNTDFLPSIMSVWLNSLKKTAKLWDCRLSNFVPMPNGVNPLNSC